MSVAAIAFCALAIGSLKYRIAEGADYLDGCDSSQTSWQLVTNDPQVRILEHSRNYHEFHTAPAAEYVQLSTKADESETLIIHTVSASRQHDELQASVWLKANRPGALLALQVQLPHQIDPRTGKPVVLEVHGQPYTNTTRWEQLSVRSTDAAILQKLTLLRGRLSQAGEGSAIDDRDMQIERLALIQPLTRGVTELFIDELQFGPLVRPESSRIDPVAGQRPEGRLESPIQLGPNRMLVEGKPFFPRFTPYFGENLDVLQEMGINVAWVDRYDDQILMDELAQRDIWAMAAPPYPEFQEEGGQVTSVNAGLMPIPASTERILFWTVGTRIKSNQLGTVEGWIDQIRDADRSFERPRPIMADVVGQERAFSRLVSVLGSTRHILHTTFSPLQYRDYLRHKKHLALPDRFSSTWIATEAATPNVETRHPSRHRPIVVEAEQIWMQAWAAISVGYREIGYWKTGPFDEETSASRERRLAIALLNAQIDLLEPWLATGKVVDSVDVNVRAYEQAPATRPGSPFTPIQQGSPAPNQTKHPEIQAAVIESKYGRLVIPVWYEDGAQFQPGPMMATNVSFLVPGVEHARAWEVTTTSVDPLDLDQPMPAGMEFRLPLLDQFAFVVITNDLKMEDKLRQRMQSVQQRCARLWVELARTRLERVRPTHEQLQQLALAKVPDADALLRTASERLAQAESQLAAQHYDEARKLSRSSLQLLRTLQRAHWANAVNGHTSPVSSPHTLCFETLPDHWRLIAAIGRNANQSNENLMRSGDFEDFDTVYADWDFKRDESQDRSVELHTDAAIGRYALRLVSRPQGTDAPFDISPVPSVSALSPGIPVRGGQVVIVSGQLRVQEPITGHPDGLMIYDNIKGTVGSLRFYGKSPAEKWQPFHLIREVARTSDFHLHIELNGDGDVRLDDIRVVTLNPVMTAGGTSTEPQRPRRKLLDFTPSLPKVRLWPGRNTDPADE